MYAHLALIYRHSQFRPQSQCSTSYISLDGKHMFCSTLVSPPPQAWRSGHAPGTRQPSRSSLPSRVVIRSSVLAIFRSRISLTFSCQVSRQTPRRSRRIRTPSSQLVSTHYASSQHIPTPVAATAGLGRMLRWAQASLGNFCAPHVRLTNRERGYIFKRPTVRRAECLIYTRCQGTLSAPP